MKTITQLKDTISSQSVVVNIHERIDDCYIQNERELSFDTVEDAILFAKGVPTKDWCGKEVVKTPKDEVNSIVMYTHFNVDKLLSYKEMPSKAASSYIGSTLYRIDIDPNVTEYGESYKIQEYEITSVEKYWNGSLVLKSNKEEVCLLENIDTEHLFLDYYVVFSSKEKAEEFVEDLKFKEIEGIDER